MYDTKEETNHTKVPTNHPQQTVSYFLLQEAALIPPNRTISCGRSQRVQRTDTDS